MTNSFAEKTVSFLTRIIGGYLSVTVREHNNHDMYLKIVMTLAISAIGSSTLFFFAIVDFFQNKHLLGLFDLAVSLFLVLNLLLFFRTGNYLLACYLGISAVGFFFFYLFVTGGVNNTAPVWLYTFPLFVFFLLGARQGTVVTLLLFVPSVIFLLLDHKIPFLATYPFDLKIRFIPSFLVVFACAYIYENLREKTQGKLENSNEELEKKVKDRTADLQSAFELATREVDVRKRLEQKLAASHLALLTIFDSLDAIVYAADITTYDILFMNQYARTIFGDGVGRKCWQVFQKDQKGACSFCSNKELIDAKGHPRSYSWEMKNTVNGRWYDMRDCAVGWNDGKVARIQIATDITPRKIAEEKILKAKKEWETTFDALIEPVFILDTNFTILRANKALSQRLGLTIDQVIGRKCHELMHDAEEPPADCPCRKMLQEGCCQSAEFPLEKLGCDFFVSVSPIVDDQGVLQGGVHVAVDITERKEAEDEKSRLIEELQQALARIRKLEGIIPICSYCRKIRNDDGYWTQLEKYISDHSEVRFSHGMCEECAKKNFPEIFDK